MAERRMFAKTIIDSDAFLDMPLSAQALYFHLSMRADDEGFINNPKKIQRMVGGSDDDMKILIAKSFIIPFESGIVVIKHWKIHNYIRGDRLHGTKYADEKAMLTVKDNGTYTLQKDDFTQCQTVDGQLVGNLDTEVRLGKVRLGKDNNIYGDLADGFMPVPVVQEVKEPDDSVKALDVFDSLWKLYPKKKGRGQVSLSTKKKILKVGQEEMTRCIERYKQYIADNNIAEQYVMYGSTFFNSGYVDYLDDNYSGEDKAVEETQNDKWQSLPTKETKTENKQWQ